MRDNRLVLVDFVDRLHRPLVDASKIGQGLDVQRCEDIVDEFLGKPVEASEAARRIHIMSSIVHAAKTAVAPIFVEGTAAKVRSKLE